MAISRFDQPAQSQFINTYSPIPFQEMMYAGESMQKQYDTSMNNLQRIYDDTYNIKYIPNSKDEDYVKKNVIPTIKNIFEKYSQVDLSDPTVYRQALRELNTNVDRQRINKIQESQAGWSDNQKWRQKLQAEGKYADYLDTPDEGYDTSVQGVYNKLTPAALDSRKKKEEYFNNLEGDRYTDPKTGEIREYIDNNQITHLAKSGYKDYLGSIEGKQDILRYRKETGDNKSSDESLAYDLLYKTGQEKKYNRVSGYAPEYVFKSKQQDPIFTGQPEALAMEDIPGSKLNKKDFKFGAKQSGETDWTTTSGPGIGAGFVVKNIRPGYNEKLLKRPDVQNIIKFLPDEYKNIYKSVTTPGSYTVDKKFDEKTRNADMGVLYDKLGEIFDNVQEHMKKGSYILKYTLPIRKQVTDDMFGTDDLSKLGAGVFANRKYYDPSTNTTYTNAGDFYKEVVVPQVKKSKKEGMTPMISVVGLLHGDNPFSHPAVTNDPDFRKGSVITIGGRNIIVSGTPSSGSEIASDATYNMMKYLPNVELDDPSVPGLKMMYDGNNYMFKNEDNTIQVSSPDFDDAYQQVYNKLRSNK